MIGISRCKNFCLGVQLECEFTRVELSVALLGAWEGLDAFRALGWRPREHLDGDGCISMIWRGR